MTNSELPSKVESITKKNYSKGSCNDNSQGMKQCSKKRSLFTHTPSGNGDLEHISKTSLYHSFNKGCSRQMQSFFLSNNTNNNIRAE